MNRLILLLILSLYISIIMDLYGQDTIIFTNGNQTISQVLEVGELQVKFKRFDNLEGPVYLANKSEISKIIYKSGVIDDFIQEDAGKTSSSYNSDKRFKTLLQKGNKVYIDSYDKSAIIHATNSMNGWGYWVVVKEEKDADFTLRIIFKNVAPGTYHGFAQFIDPKDNEIFHSTREVTGVANFDLNGKRVFIKKLINYEIQSFN